MTNEFEEKLDKALSQMNDIQSQFTSIVQNYNAMKDQNTNYRRAMLNIEKAIIELRLAELENGNSVLPVQKETESILDSFSLPEAHAELCPKCAEEIKDIFKVKPVEVCINSSETLPECDPSPEREEEEVVVKPAKKRGRPKGSGTKKAEPVIEEGGSVFTEFESLNLAEVTEDHKHMSAYLASDDDIAKAREEDRHPNRLGALGAVCSTSKAI